MIKYICIKDIDRNSFEANSRGHWQSYLYFKSGTIYNVEINYTIHATSYASSHDTPTLYIYATYIDSKFDSKTSHMLNWTHDMFIEHFMPLDESREKKINEILSLQPNR
jgi:hypothetical protein